MSPTFATPPATGQLFLTSGGWTLVLEVRDQVRTFGLLTAHVLDLEYEAQVGSLLLCSSRRAGITMSCVFPQYIGPSASSTMGTKQRAPHTTIISPQNLDL